MNDPLYFLWDQQRSVVTITFNRPQKRNGIDLRVMLELESLISRARDAGDVKVIVFTGEGNAFCAGADLTLARDAQSKEERARIEAEMRRVPRIIGRIYDTLLHMDVVSIASVNGYAVGGGWTLALACDHVIAAREAAFWLPEVQIGSPFRGLANVKLTQALGPMLAKEAMILGRRFSADELADLRLVNLVCPRDELDARTREAVDAYLALPWNAVLNTRRDIHASLYGPQHY